jgi:hypothetical protein
MILLSLLGCVDQGFSEVRLDAIAVVLGDFDNVTEPLTALNIATVPYNGFIVQATYEPDEERTQADDPGIPSVEGLLTGVNAKCQLDLSGYNAVFVNSGTRGLGAGMYNNMLEPDDMLLADPDNLDHLCEFAEGGGTLVVSDWAYDLVEFCWPDSIEFFGDDLTVDAAQAGIADHDVLATVNDQPLIDALGEAFSITYDYTAWSVIESVGGDVETLLSGDVDYQPSAEELPATLTDAPMMVRFHPGRGQVVYTTFHWAAQTPTVAQGLLLNAVEGLHEGSGAQSAEATGE